VGDETKQSAYLDERQGFTELTAFSVLVGDWRRCCQPQFSNHHSSKK